MRKHNTKHISILQKIHTFAMDTVIVAHSNLYTMPLITLNLHQQ
jgi:hypothetical protein